MTSVGSWLLILSESNLSIHTQDNDSRGKIFRGDFHNKERFLIAEIKKGTSRGGHFHDVDTFHLVLIGKIEYYEKLLERDGKEKLGQNETKKIFVAGNLINTPAYTAHLVRAIDDSVIIEPSGEKKSITYKPFRKLVEIKKDN